MTWYQTKLTELLRISYPVIQAGMAGGVTSPQLVASVSNAGGLGTLGAGYMAPDAIRKEIREIRALTNRPFAVNLMVPLSYKNDLEKERRMKNCLQQFERAVGAPHEEPIQKSDYSFADLGECGPGRKNSGFQLYLWNSGTDCDPESSIQSDCGDRNSHHSKGSGLPA